LKNLRKRKYRRKFPGLFVRFGVPLPVGSASLKGWKIFVNGVKSLLGHPIPVMDSTSDYGFIRFQPCLLLIKVRFVGSVGWNHFTLSIGNHLFLSLYMTAIRFCTCTSRAALAVSVSCPCLSLFLDSHSA
jgi:hypothetical protein